MKIVNNRLEDIDNKEVKVTMLEINNLILDFLNREYNNVGTRYQLHQKIEGLVIELLPTSKEKFMTLYNGQKHQFLPPSNASTFVTKIYQLYKDRKWFFSNGIVFPFSFERTKNKKKIHEYLHFLSSNEILESINNRYYDKIGLCYVTYDELDNVVDRTFSCGFLNEGMTEYLTSKITDTYPDAYEFNVLIIELLTINNRCELIDAYFSKDFQKIVDYKNLFEKTSGFKFDIIFNNDQYGINITQDRIEKMIISCMAFQINLALSLEELEQIQNSVVTILQKYSNSLDFSFDRERIINKVLEMINIQTQNLIVKRNK